MTEWPNDPDELARIAAGPDQSGEARERAFQALVPVIQQVARRVGVRFGAVARSDILEEAPGEVWQALRGFRPGESFSAWCYSVVRNHVLDRLRRDQREWRRRQVLAERQPARVQEALESALDRTDTLGEADLEAVRSWPLPQRLVLLCLSGLWQRLPPAEWQRWVDAYRAEVDGDLPLPFPPELLQQCEDIAQRNGLLAEAMRVRRNTLSVWLHRYKGRLAELRYVRALLGTDRRDA